jgi:uncharacterized protein YndB with AHSA1/START domain
MSEKPGGREVRQEIYIEASPETVFALLTDATEIKKWQAEIVDADPVPGGVFRLAESGGMQIEGHYVEVVPYCKVVFTWGGIVGVAPGESTVEFLLEPNGTGTLVRLRHYNLPASSFDAHDREWALARPLPKGAIQAGFASAARDDRGVRSRRGGIMRPATAGAVSLLCTRAIGTEPASVH